MSDWKESLLEDLSDDITVGFVGSMVDEYVDKGIPFLRSKNVEPHRINFDDIRYITYEFHQKIKKSTLTSGDVVIVRTGKPGAAALIPNSLVEANCSDLVIVRPSCNLDRRFLVYYLNSISVRHINSNLVGAVQQHFNIGAARKLKINHPNIEEQKQIADVLSCLDAKIENLRRQNETLEQIAQTLFKHWFIDFEFPNADGKPYKSSGGAMFASELGDIPEGWKVGKLGAIGKIITGKTPSTQSPNLWGDDLPFITPTDFKNYGKYILSAERKISQLAISQFKQYIVPRNSIVVTCIGSDMGKVAKTSISCITNQQINSIVLLQDFYFHEYIFNYLKSQYKLLRNIALGGSTMPIINKSAFSNIEILMPSLELLNYFENIISALNQKIINNENQIQTLTKTRDSLLPKLMSGQLRVKK